MKIHLKTVYFLYYCAAEPGHYGLCKLIIDLLNLKLAHRALIKNTINEVFKPTTIENFLTQQPITVVPGPSG